MQDLCSTDPSQEPRFTSCRLYASTRQLGPDHTDQECTCPARSRSPTAVGMNHTDHTDHLDHTDHTDHTDHLSEVRNIVPLRFPAPFRHYDHGLD